LLPLLLGIVVGAVFVLAWKPWATDPGVSRATTAPPSGGPSATPASPPAIGASATPTASPDEREVPCISTDGWRIVTLERTAGREVRTWIAIDPARARGPRDPAIPSDRISSGRLLALGFCGPAGALPATGAETVRLWRLTTRGAGGPVTGAQHLTTPPRVTPPRAGSAELYVPPEGRRDWAVGRYAFEVIPSASTGGAAGGRSLWFGVEVLRAEEPPLSP
jgi:hypothetical protein